MVRLVDCNVLFVMKCFSLDNVQHNCGVIIFFIWVVFFFGLKVNFHVRFVEMS